MRKNDASFIREQLDFQCIICSQQYDTEQRQMISVCSNNHSVCKRCVNVNLFKNDQQKCPYCREEISKQSIKILPSNILIKKINELMPNMRKKNNQLFQQLQMNQHQLIMAQQHLKIVTEQNQTILLENQKLHKELQIMKNKYQTQKKQVGEILYQIIETVIKVRESRQQKQLQDSLIEVLNVIIKVKGLKLPRQTEQNVLNSIHKLFTTGK